MSKNRFHFLVHHKLFYAYAKFQGSRLSRTGVNQGPESAPPSRLPRASNTLGLICWGDEIGFVHGSFSAPPPRANSGYACVLGFLVRKKKWREASKENKGKSYPVVIEV